MRCLQRFCAKVEPSHWVVLNEDVAGYWSFVIWGGHPLSGRFSAEREQDAKEKALTAAREHLQEHGLQSNLTGASEPVWRVAVRCLVP